MFEMASSHLESIIWGLWLGPQDRYGSNGTGLVATLWTTQLAHWR